MKISQHRLLDDSNSLDKITCCENNSVIEVDTCHLCNNTVTFDKKNRFYMKLLIKCSVKYLDYLIPLIVCGHVCEFKQHKYSALRFNSCKKAIYLQFQIMINFIMIY